MQHVMLMRQDVYTLWHVCYTPSVSLSVSMCRCVCLHVSWVCAWVCVPWWCRNASHSAYRVAQNTKRTIPNFIIKLYRKNPSLKPVFFQQISQKKEEIEYSKLALNILRVTRYVAGVVSVLYGARNCDVASKVSPCTRKTSFYWKPDKNTNHKNIFTWNSIRWRMSTEQILQRTDSY